MIVPLDAWNKMLNQLGNLHEAGQQLAEARERAAKAETEAVFLRERLAELRDAPHPLSGEKQGGETEPPSPASPVLPPRGGETEPPSPASPVLPPTERLTEPWMPEDTEPEAVADVSPPTTPSLWVWLSNRWKSRRR